MVLASIHFLVAARTARKDSQKRAPRLVGFRVSGVWFRVLVLHSMITVLFNMITVLHTCHITVLHSIIDRYGSPVPSSSSSEMGGWLQSSRKSKAPMANQAPLFTDPHGLGFRAV